MPPKLPPKNQYNLNYKYDNKYDFLKYWAVVRRWAVHSYELKSIHDLEMLIFLYTENIFSQREFEKFDNYIPWDSKRFKRLIDQGYIQLWRKSDKYRWDLYDLTPKAKRMVNSIYKKLLGLEPIPESRRRNRAFLKKAPFSKKTLALAIKDVNKEHKQRLSPESQKASPFQ